MLHVFDNSSLLPEAWRSPDVHAVRMFNPGLLRDRDGWLLAYRVVSEPDLRRRVALCRLDQSFRVAPGSALPLSDAIRFSKPEEYPEQARTWFADPRLYRLQGRLFVYWNSGWHEPQNHQFLQELDPTTFRPIGEPRELTLVGTRQKLEKNWALFEHDGLFAVYSVNPHRVLGFSLAGEGPIACADIASPIRNPGGYAQTHGGLRGGAPPQRHGGHFYSFCHSIENDPAGYRYAVAAYRFSATAPFAPTDMPREPLSIEVPACARRALPKLNSAVGEVLYPAGAAYEAGKWIVSLGVDDERCAIAVIDPERVDAMLEPAATP